MVCSAVRTAKKTKRHRGRCLTASARTAACKPHLPDCYQESARRPTSHSLRQIARDSRWLIFPRRGRRAKSNIRSQVAACVFIVESPEEDGGASIRDVVPRVVSESPLRWQSRDCRWVRLPVATVDQKSTLERWPRAGILRRTSDRADASLAGAGPHVRVARRRAFPPRDVSDLVGRSGSETFSTAESVGSRLND